MDKEKTMIQLERLLFYGKRNNAKEVIEPCEALISFLTPKPPVRVKGGWFHYSQCPACRAQLPAKNPEAGGYYPHCPTCGQAIKTGKEAETE